MPPVPGRGDDVRQREAREADVGAGAGRRAAQREPERVAGVLDDLQAVAVGDRADRVPVGRVADEVRREDRLGARADHLLDARRRRSGTCRA